jgi:hypothetical protein
MPKQFEFTRGDLLERAAVCDRALSVVDNPEYCAVLKKLRELWMELAEESPAVLKTVFADEIFILSRLQAEIAASSIH